MIAPFAMLGVQELWPIAIVVLVLFGAKRLPEMARSMGQGIKEFKKGLREIDEEDDRTAPRAASEDKVAKE
jgi:sec-independent protein translocase protein TatA